MRALALQHADVEHAGAFATWWAQAGLELDLCRPYAGDVFPDDLAAHDALVVLGGPQTVTRADGGVDPAELALVRHAVATGVPMLGVCLGAQILAVATGGVVEPGPAPEHGAGTVTLTEAADGDPLLHSLGRGQRQVVQWHGDGITELPPDATLLATSAAYPVQAFRVADAWGFQFHAEADVDMVTAWAEYDGMDPAPLLPAVSALELEPAWRPVADAFAGLVRARA